MTLCTKIANLKQDRTFKRELSLTFSRQFQKLIDLCEDLENWQFILDRTRTVFKTVVFTEDNLSQASLPAQFICLNSQLVPKVKVYKVWRRAYTRNLGLPVGVDFSRTSQKF